jgi:flavin-dependent dehydrogenase
VTSLPRSTDVFICGGGPAGLAAAIAARRRGFDVTVADSAVPPIDKACGEGLMPDGLAAAASLGLDLSKIEGHPFRGIRFCGDGASVQAAFPDGQGLGVRRTTLHEWMAAHAAGAGVRLAWGTRIEGIRADGVLAGGRLVRARWIVGADGGHSAVRKWAGLESCSRESLRFGFRRHFHMAPWSEYMEIHWGAACQLYVTPVACDEICVVVISGRRLRLDEALRQFPEVSARLESAAGATAERGGISATRRLRAVCRDNVALVGDASGSVDAITGEGLCLLFQHAEALGIAMEAGDLAPYAAAHRRLGRRPQWMSDLMLLLDGRRRLRQRAIQTMAANPRDFDRLLAMHVGSVSVPKFLANGMAFGWHMLTL